MVKNEGDPMWKKVLRLLGAAALAGLVYEGGKAIGRFDEAVRLRLKEERLRLKEERLKKLEEELSFLEESIRERQDLLSGKKEIDRLLEAKLESTVCPGKKKVYPYKTIFDAIAADDGAVALEMAGDANLKLDAALSETALHWAAQAGNLSVVEIFTEHGADIDARDINLVTPLHKAVQGGHLPVVAYLIEKGAPVNAKASNGLTPLHSAVHAKRKEIIGLLLSKGADPESKDMFDCSPLSIAEESGNEEIIAILYGEK
jgi:hypothetical protein